MDQKVASETISKVLYPNDEPEAGKQLRLAQQFFFVSCSLQDMIRLHLMRQKPLHEFDSYWAAQLNDTHPSIAVAELMRLLVDEHLMDWDQAWAITQRTCGYTNHTLLAEALEKWPLSLFGTLLPRHLEIVHEINRRFLDDVRQRFRETISLLRRLSLIDEDGGRYVRMAHLASVGSHAINGVAALHTDLLKKTVLRDFHTVAPEQVPQRHQRRDAEALDRPEQSETERVDHQTHRRAMDLGPGGGLQEIEPLAGDAGFQSDWREVKAANKARAGRVHQGAHRCHGGSGIALRHPGEETARVQASAPDGAVPGHALQPAETDDPPPAATPRTVIFGGKAAPGYRMAKLIIKLINAVGGVINQDPRVSDVLKVVFLPDFNVKNSHRVYPAADLSEQISTAGKEASGTGNMKFAMNGALTIGTLDGANVEIRDAVGPENFFLFGLTADEVDELKARGYTPRSFYESNAELREAIDQIGGGFFSNGDRELFRPLVESLLTRDDYMLLADYQAYVDCQQRVSDAYRDQNAWTRMSILNSARVGRFSSDRSIRDYCRDIWNVSPITPARS